MCLPRRTRTVHDPFLGKDVQVSDNLVDRLCGKYAVGPTLENGEPEFGYRQMLTVPIQEEAANEIVLLRTLLLTLANAADDVGVHHFDTDTWSAEVAAMDAATKAARAALDNRGRI